MKLVLFFVIINLVKDTESLFVDDELRSASIVYGLSSIVGKEYGNLTECNRDLKVFLDGANDNQVWTIKVVDASGGPASGFYDGNNFWIGSHQACVELQERDPLKLNYERIRRGKIEDFTYPPYKLDFMVFHIRHNSTLQLQFRKDIDDRIILGLCVPASCRVAVIESLLKEYFRKEYMTFQRRNNLELNVLDGRKLHIDDNWIYPLPKTILVFVVLVILLILLITGTLVGNVHKNESNLVLWENVIGKKLHDVLVCFDVIAQAKFLYVKNNASGSNVPCLNGLKVVFMVIIIFAHSVYFKLDYMMSLSVMFRQSETFLLQIFMNAALAPDTFFLLGGFLTSYLFFYNKRSDVTKDCAKSWSLFKQFVNKLIARYVRLTPTYAAVIIIVNVTSTFLRGNYPIHNQENLDVNCDTNWWMHLLYVNNLLNSKDMCMSWTYYNAIDMQLYSLATLLLILSTVFFKLAAFLVLAFITCSTAYIAYVMHTIEMKATMDDWMRNYDRYYKSSLVRIQPYFIGVIAGYLLAVKIGKEMKLKKIWSTAIWTTTISCNLYVMFCLHNRDRSVLFTIVYMSLSRIVWSIGLSWIIIACHTGNGGVINWALSCRLMEFLSKFTYAVYLLNPFFMTTVYESSGTTFSQNFLMNTFLGFGLLSATYFFGIFMTLAIEYPFIAVYKLIN